MIITIIDILKGRHSSVFCGNTGIYSESLHGVIPDHHELVVELRENGFDSLAEPPVCLGGGTPVFLIKAVRDFERDVCRLEKVQLYRCAQIPLVAENHAVMKLPSDIFRVLDVMNMR